MPLTKGRAGVGGDGSSDGRLRIANDDARLLESRQNGVRRVTAGSQIPGTRRL